MKLNKRYQRMAESFRTDRPIDLTGKKEAGRHPAGVRWKAALAVLVLALIVGVSSGTYAAGLSAGRKEERKSERSAPSYEIRDDTVYMGEKKAVMGEVRDSSGLKILSKEAAFPVGDAVCYKARVNMDHDEVPAYIYGDTAVVLKYDSYANHLFETYLKGWLEQRAGQEKEDAEEGTIIAGNFTAEVLSVSGDGSYVIVREHDGDPQLIHLSGDQGKTLVPDKIYVFTTAPKEVSVPKRFLTDLSLSELSRMTDIVNIAEVGPESCQGDEPTLHLVEKKAVNEHKASKLYTEEEIGEAIDAVKEEAPKKFDKKPYFVSLSYAGDDRTGLNTELLQRFDADQVITLKAEFYLEAMPEDYFTNWEFSLVKKDKGRWEIANMGF